MIPLSLGESPVFNLADYGVDEYSPYGMGEVSDRGYGPYLGNIWDDLQKIAGRVGTIAGEVGKVVSGDKQVITVPSNQALASTAKSSLPWVLGGAALLYFVLRKKR